MKRFILIFVALTANQSSATLQECRQTVRESIDSCREAGESARASGDAADAALMAQAGTNVRTGSENLNAAASANAQRWSGVKATCQAVRNKCADKCNAVNESPQAKKQAEEDKYDCFGKINQVITQAERGISSNTVATAESAETGNVAGQQGAETIEGNVIKIGSGPQGIAFTQGGVRKIYYSSNVGGNLSANMNYLKGISDPGTIPILMMPGK